MFIKWSFVTHYVLEKVESSVLKMRSCYINIVQLHCWAKAVPEQTQPFRVSHAHHLQKYLLFSNSEKQNL